MLLNKPYPYLGGSFVLSAQSGAVHVKTPAPIFNTFLMFNFISQSSLHAFAFLVYICFLVFSIGKEVINAHKIE